MTDEEIAAEYARCLKPDGTYDMERFREMSRRLYGIELQEGAPITEAEAEARQRAWREVVAQ